MPTLDERKFELKQKRSDALMAKINVLRARDGSVYPPIASMKEEDNFNLGLLFGQSRSENIAWGAMGVEGLIRCYYEIIFKLKGIVRNNIIKSGTASGDATSSHNSTVRSGLKSAVDWLSDGQGYKSGFYIGWDGIDTEVNDTGNRTRKQRLNNALSRGRRGEFDVPMTEGWTALATQLGKPSVSSSFTDNRDRIEKYNPIYKKIELVYPTDERSSSILSKFDALVALVGSDSPRGPHNATIPFLRPQTPWTRYVNNTLLGKRHRDVAPFEYHAPYTSHHQGDDGEDEDVEHDGSIRYGNGVWDDVGQSPYPSGYIPTPDFWDPQYEIKTQAIITAINDIINYIGFTKIVNFTYIINTKIVPGIDPNYNPNDPNSNIGSSWNLQNGWINQLITIRNRLQQSLDLIAQHMETTSKTKTVSRSIVDNELFQIKSLLPTWIAECNGLGDIINNIFGEITNPLSLYGHRFLWIRTLIHPSEGSLTAVNSTGMAIDVMEKKLKKSEDELLMFGIFEDEYIPTPIIVGIEPYPVMNQATFEMEIGGWLVAWGGQEHCTGYDVWKSDDYNPSTKNGTWKKIEVSNTQYTISDINVNNGKVFTYIIDSDIEPIPPDTDPANITHPYYKVKAYDYNGGSGDYYRKNASSEECEPMNPAAFPFGGQQQNSGGRKTPETKITEVGSSIPPNTLFWVTNHNGSDADDFERRVFKSEAPFDSIASNLIVFVDGKFKNKGTEAVGGDYELIDIYTIRFNQSIPIESEVNLVVALRSFASKTRKKGTVKYFNDLLDITDMEAGDIWFVEEPSPGLYYQWIEPLNEWKQVADPESSSIWRDPVNTFSQLPTTLNSDGDIRLVLDTSILYRWDGAKQIWAKISGSAGSGWLAPVDTSDDLDAIDTTDLINGAVIFVISEESLYRWSKTQNGWIRIAGSSAANWKNPVNSITQLPTTGNSEGDIRLVLTENKMYRWYAWEQEWKATKSDADLAHGELNDDDWETVNDHDARYYPKTDIDSIQIEINQRLTLLESLKPKNAEPLHGDFIITGTKLYEGFLSDGGSILHYDVLKPGDFFRRIIKDANFIMSNSNSQQFKDADKGILYCYINNVKVDEFNLGQWFNESERESGQTYPRQFGTNNVIEILSVGPYNQYATYQRADFQLNIRDELLTQGENKIKLVHEVGNDTEDINSTDDFIVFWDEFDGEMGFKEIYIDEVELNSIKYLSGVRYYSIGDKLRLRFTAENLFNNTYIEDKQIYIGLDDFAITGKHINFKHSNVIGFPTARIGERVLYLEESVLSVDNIYNSVPSLKLEATNPFKTQTQIKNNTNILINTVNNRSTDKEENFADEYYRLPFGNYNSIPSQITGQWNSQQSLTTNDLQVFGCKLIYPQENFSKYKPNQVVNYSSFSGAKYFYRAFRDIKPHNNGKFIIPGFNIDPNIKIDIKLPGLTGWMSINKLYNAAIFSGGDGDGCLIIGKNDIYEWTSGGFSTADSGYIIIIRVTMYAKTNYISNIKLEW